jgi:hypothetical protein
MDDVERRKICPYRDSNSCPSAIQPIASRYTDCAIPAPPVNYVELINLNPYTNLFHTFLVQMSADQGGRAI